MIVAPSKILRAIPSPYFSLIRDCEKPLVTSVLSIC